MGKSLKGKELGKGIYQRKDGLYHARFSDKLGNKYDKYTQTVVEAKNWLAEMNAADYLDELVTTDKMTVDEWFSYWIENIVGDLAPNTIRNYRERYEKNVKPVIGRMDIANVKPMHCKKILIQMDKDYAGSTIRQTYITMGTMFKAAKMNGIISKHPMDGVRYTKPVKSKSDIQFMTVEEQAKFLETIKKTHNYYPFAFVLETGLRTSELIGLTWDCVDIEKRTLTINKTLEYRHSTKVWRAGPPKTQSGYRTIPLTNRAVEILTELQAAKSTRKESPDLDQTLVYIDRHSGKTASMNMKNLVFLNWRTGMPTKNSAYDTFLYRMCESAGIGKFYMHALRHTYATRAIESGIQPKVLQTLLGHSSIKTTMDIYVHVTDESMAESMKKFENYSTKNANNFSQCVKSA